MTEAAFQKGFLILPLKALKGPHVFQGSLSVTPGLPRANSAPPPESLAVGQLCPEPSRDVSYGAGRGWKTRRLPRRRASLAWKPASILGLGPARSQALTSCGHTVWAFAWRRGPGGEGRPLSLLLSLVLKRTAAGPWLLARPAGGCGETGPPPTCPALLSVPTALRTAAHEPSCRSGGVGLRSPARPLR